MSPVVRRRRRWEDNIKVDLKEIELAAPVTSSCEHGKAASRSVRGDVLLDQVSDRQLLQKDFAP